MDKRGGGCVATEEEILLLSCLSCPRRPWRKVMTEIQWTHTFTLSSIPPCTCSPTEKEGLIRREREEVWVSRRWGGQLGELEWKE